MRRFLVPVAVVVSALCLTQAAAPTTAAGRADGGADRAATERAPALVRTPFAVQASAYGTRASGGQLPLDSDDTAFQVMGCTNLVGQSRRNFVATQNIPGLGRAEGVTTRVWTEKRGRTVSSWSSHRIARLVLAQSGVGSLQVRGLTSLSHAFNKAGRFGATTETSIAKLLLVPPGGAPPQTLPIPTPGQPVVVPGLARIAIGTSQRSIAKDGALARADVLDVRVLPLGTRAQVAHTQAAITSGVGRGVFSGYSAGVMGRGLDDNTKIGRLPLSLMPCQGTRNRQEGKDIARLDLGHQVVVSGVSTSQRARSTRTFAEGRERGRVARVSIGEGRVVITGIVGQVVARRTAKGVTTKTAGSTVGKLVVDGQVRALPRNRPLVIPGLVKLDDVVKTKVDNGVKVIGLRVTVLDGSGAVIDLGVAQLAIKPGVGKRR